MEDCIEDNMARLYIEKVKTCDLCLDTTQPNRQIQIHVYGMCAVWVGTVT